MSEEHQNPDAHYCSLMCTENRVTGNHLPDDQPICNLKDLEIGKCIPSKLELVNSMITMFTWYRGSLPVKYLASIS